jgi:NADH:ubiquinone oxidoreductase subunit E
MAINTIDLAEQEAPASEFDLVNSTVEKYRKMPSALISILQDIQEKIGYLPPDILKRVAEKTELPLTQIYGVATFFKSLSLNPQGRHIVTICMGTACHVRGAGKILSEVSSFLEIEPGETTGDGEFTLRAVNCLGACAIGPVMVVDGKYYGKMSASRANALLDKCRS